MMDVLCDCEAMPARQLWAFLTDADLRELIGKIAAREPGLVVSQGRYLRGDPRLLLEDPALLEHRESLPAVGVPGARGGWQ